MNIFRKLVDWYFSKEALPYWMVLLIDCLICYLSGILVFWFYYRGAVTLGNVVLLSKTIAVYMCFNFIGFRVFHTYSGIIRYSSFVDLQRLAYAMMLSCAIAEVAHYAIYFFDWNFVRLQGRQIFLMYFMATLLMWAERIIVKAIYDVAFSSEKGLRVLVFGIREGGVAMAKMIRNTKPARFQLKGFLTKERQRTSQMMMGVRIYTIDDDLPHLLKSMNIQAVLVSPLMVDQLRNDSDLQDQFIDAGVQIYMAALSKPWEKGDEIDTTQLKEINIEDLLPRNQIEVDLPAIGEMLAGKHVMITGSAGSIGSEMVRQIATFHPANLILVDQAETPQHNVRLMMAREFSDIPCETIVSSITQKQRMEHIFQTYQPEYLFHAAAYKHVPMMEDNPSEAIYNNVYGTKVIADLSVKYGVRKFVMISTDKAVNPTSVMGCSKRICEIYCQSLSNAILTGDVQDGRGEQARTQFVTTRFGNVLGSNGSVIPLFEKQIKAGGPLTVTHPDIIRYFMLIPEACQLVLEAGTHGKGGQIFVFDMGEPVKIADLARRMIKLSGVGDMRIEYTGLRPGEKLYEEVLSNAENTLPSFHEKIRISKVREYDFSEARARVDELVDASLHFDNLQTVARMKEMVPEYHPNNRAYDVLNKQEQKEKETKQP